MRISVFLIDFTLTEFALSIKQLVGIAFAAYFVIVIPMNATHRRVYATDESPLGGMQRGFRQHGSH